MLMRCIAHAFIFTGMNVRMPVDDKQNDLVIPSTSKNF
jgi:hypothetical protein